MGSTRIDTVSQVTKHRREQARAARKKLLELVERSARGDDVDVKVLSAAIDAAEVPGAVFDALVTARRRRVELAATSAELPARIARAGEASTQLERAFAESDAARKAIEAKFAAARLEKDTANERVTEAREAEREVRSVDEQLARFVESGEL